MSNFGIVTPIDSPRPAESLPSISQHVGIETLVQFLFGSREAIRTLAARPDTLWLGLVFVISAGFAREYDGEDLLHEPRYLLLPLAASLGSSALLFLLVEFVAWCRGFRSTNIISRYRTFLSLYWMTAPLAWIYAIPVERFLSAGDATRANLWFLAIVSFWRVLLITQVLSTLYVPGCYESIFTGMGFVVMLFADTLAIYLMSLVNLQILMIMGGVRLTDAELVLAEAKLIVMLLGVLLWPVWLMGTLAVMCLRVPPWSWTSERISSPAPISSPVKLLAAGSLLIWAFFLPWTQPEQQLRHAVERDLQAGKYRQAFVTMSAHRRDEFPPIWDPPPHIGSRVERSRIIELVEALTGTESPWVRKLFIDKLDAALGNSFHFNSIWAETNVIELLSLLNRLPEGPSLLKERLDLMRRFASYDEVPKETRRHLEATCLRVQFPIPEVDSKNWPDTRIDIWREFLQRWDKSEDLSPVRMAYKADLDKLLDENDSLPDELRERIRKLLGTE